jgi:uncharacterized protein YbaR (Trm112 family)
VLIVLTDVLTCPRCGPDFGLVLLADRLEQRRVIEGRLGCPNCRESYPIRGGVADLRFPPGRSVVEHDSVAATAGHDDDVLAVEEAAVRIAALLGLAGGPGLILLLGEPARLGGAVARLVPEVSIAAAGPAVGRPTDEAGVSRLLTADRLPFRTRSVRAVAVGGGPASALSEAVRLVAPGGRLVVDGALPGTPERLRQEGLDVLLDQDDVVVAMR